MSCSDNWLVPAANPCLGVKEVIAGTNVTITGSIYTPTINATGGGGGVTSLAYTTGINGSGSTGAVTLSNTGVTSIIAGTGIGISGGTGAVTISNTSIGGGGITNLVAGGNISITNVSTISVLADPRFTTSMGFIGSGTTSIFSNVVYPYGLPQYYPYVTNSGTDVLNTIGGKQFWATLTPGNTTVQVMRYAYTGIDAQQGSTGTTIPFLNFNNSTGLFSLSNLTSIDAPSGLNFNNRGLSNISTISGSYSGNFINFYNSNTGIEITSPQGSLEFYPFGYPTVVGNIALLTSDITTISSVNVIGFKTAGALNYAKPLILMDSGSEFISLQASNGVTITGGLSVDGNIIGPGFSNIYGRAYITGLSLINTTAITMVVFDGINPNVGLNLNGAQDIIQTGGYSGYFRLDYEVNVEPAIISTDFTIFVRPVIVDAFLVNTPTRGGGWLSCVGPATAAFLRVSGSDIIYFDAATNAGFALEYQVNTATGIPSPTIAFNNPTVVGFAFNSVQMIVTKIAD